MLTNRHFDERFPVPGSRVAAIELAMVTIVRRRRALRPAIGLLGIALAFVAVSGGATTLASGGKLAQAFSLATFFATLSTLALALVLVSALSWKARLAHLRRDVGGRSCIPADAGCPPEVRIVVT